MSTLRLAAFLAFLLAALPAAGAPPPDAAAPLPESLVLVAKPELRDPLYGQTVLVVTALGRDQHIGFIINRPTPVTLEKMFPDHDPSKAVRDPVFLGGPVVPEAIFALVARPDSPGGKSIELMPGLFAAVDAQTVDEIIEAHPNDARFMAGLVVWRPGELRHEIDLGAWHVLDADPELAFRDPDGLWEELVRRSEREQKWVRAQPLHARADIACHG